MDPITITPEEQAAFDRLDASERGAQKALEIATITASNCLAQVAVENIKLWDAIISKYNLDNTKIHVLCGGKIMEKRQHDNHS
jgi:hypothetical protein